MFFKLFPGLIIWSVLPVSKGAAVRHNRQMVHNALTRDPNQMKSSAMTNDHKSGTVWLFVKVSAFTLLVPGSVVVLVPRFLLPDSSVGSLNFSGVSISGVLPILFGIALYFRSAYDFAFTGGGTPLPIDAPVTLVTNGPYRYTRNPMYVGILSILMGEAVLYSSLSLLYVMGAMFVVFSVFIILYEERVLRKNFGESFDRYCKAVPRWFSLRVHR